MKFCNSAGQIILEVLISVALFALVAFSIATVLRSAPEVLINDIQKGRALYLAREALEAVKAIAQDDFTQLQNGKYALTASEGKWMLTNDEGKEGEFYRQVYIQDYDKDKEIKKISAKVKWSLPYFQKENVLTLNLYLTNTNIFGLQLGSPNNYLIANIVPWEASSYTVVLWVKPLATNQPEGSSLFANQNVNQLQNLLGFLQIEIDANSNYQVNLGNFSLTIGPIENKWSQLAVTWDGATLRTYYNGEEKSSQSLNKNDGDKSFSAYLVGTSADKTKGFLGIYKNLMVFDRALTSKEIRNLFSGDLPSLEGLRLYWKMNEGEGNLVQDFSPFDIAGEIIGQPLWRNILEIKTWEEVADF